MSGRHQILGDHEFWTRLEFAASRWLGCAEDRSLGGFWIDGFEPETATNTQFGVDVEGAAWVVKGQRQQHWRFIASLPQKMLRQRTPGFEIEKISLNEDDQMLGVLLVNGTSVTEPGAALEPGPAFSD